MSDHSAIEWTDATWNPVTGCTKVSPACAHCYIERTPAFRINGRRFVKGATDVRLHDDRLDQPLKWRKPRRVFVNSLSDLFHNEVSDQFISLVFAAMALSPQHTFQVLTKRPQRMCAYLQEMTSDPDAYCFAWAREYFDTERTLREIWPLPNVWLGVSVENQHFADERIPLLLQTPAAVRFISAEPLLGPLDLRNLRGGTFDAITGCVDRERLNVWDKTARLDWVICGGESGPKVRPTDPEWVRVIREECSAAGVPFFFKQWGGRTSKTGGRLLDGRTWDEFPGGKYGRDEA
jgi:protein gp37